MTLDEARQALESDHPRVVYTAISGAELHGDIKYVTGPYVWVRYDRTHGPKATAAHLLELEA